MMLHYNVSINCNMMVTSRIIKNIIHEHTHLLNDVNFVNKSLNLLYYKIDYYTNPNTKRSSYS